MVSLAHWDCLLAQASVPWTIVFFHLLAMLHTLWCKSLECHNLLQLVCHLRQTMPLPKDATDCIVRFLKLPDLNIVARTERCGNIRYAFWNPECSTVEVAVSREEFPSGDEQGWLITCDVNFQVLALNQPLHMSDQVRYDTVRVKSVRQHHDITDVAES